MTAFTSIPKQVVEAMEEWSGKTSRRDFLKNSGLLVVSFSAAAMAGTSLLSPAASAQGAAPQAAGPYPDPDFHQLDSWIVIHEDSTATFYVGKTDGGQGTGTAFRQMMADELDIAFDKTRLIMGITDITVDQGGSGGSDGIEVDELSAGVDSRYASVALRGPAAGVSISAFNVVTDPHSGQTTR